MSTEDSDANPTAEAPEASQHEQEGTECDERSLQLFTCNVEQLLNDRVSSCDMMWSLFVAAARSYRFSSILHPFPPMYRSDTEEEKNIFALRDAIAQVPKFTESQEILQSLPKDCQELLSWVLLSKNFRLAMKEKDGSFPLIKELTMQVMSAPEPTYIFEVIHSTEKEQKFELLRGTRKTLHAYHGSRFDNFYSILHNGLNNHLNKVSLFGEGVYLSSELSVSLMYSQAGEAWRNSSLGTRMSCVAVCQMIDDPSVKCQVKEGTEVQQRQRARASRTTDAVPEKYYVVQNNEVMRVKYLLVYKEENSPQPVSTSQVSSYSWIRDHKFPLLMLAYVLLLVAIGLANSRQSVNSLVRFYKSIKFS